VQLAQSLQQISPLATLARGYAVAINAQGNALTSVDEIALDETLNIRLHHGQVRAVVTSKDPAGTPHFTKFSIEESS
jgi:exodeoxyribonuclease VII large subunit